MKGFSLGDRVRIFGDKLWLSGVLVEHPPQFIENTPILEGKRLEDYPDYISVKTDDGEIYLINTKSYNVLHAE